MRQRPNGARILRKMMQFEREAPRLRRNDGQGVLRHYHGLDRPLDTLRSADWDLKSVALSSSTALDARVKRTHPGALREILAANLRRVRMEKELSQDGLADLCEIDRTYISGIERGVRNISIDNLERLAIGHRMEPWELIRRQAVGR